MQLRSLAPLAATVALAACGSTPAPAPLGVTHGAKSTDRLVIGGQAAMLAVPRQSTRKVVIYAHGAGETAAGSFTDPEDAALFSALLRGGYAVAATDAHGDNWGSAASMRDYPDLLAVLRSRGLTRIYVLAQSMGGFDGLALLADAHVRAWAGIFPACDLAAVSKLGRFTAAITAAHGAGLDVALRDLSPIHPAYRRGLPMRFWSSPGDTYIPKATNTDPCSAAARRAGARVTVTTTRGEHGDLSNFDAAGVVRLFDSA